MNSFVKWHRCSDHKHTAKQEFGTITFPLAMHALLKNASKFKLVTYIGAITLIAVLSGCTPERKVSGQIFVVTQGRENVKMGLVSVYVTTSEKLNPIAGQLLRDYNKSRLSRLQLAETERLNQLALQKFSQDVQKMNPRGMSVEVYYSILSECVRRRDGSQSLALTISPDDPLEVQFLINTLLTNLTPAQTKTDADGRFIVRAKPGDWLLAQATRMVGDKEEKYFWANQISKESSQALLSNDCQLDSPASLCRFLGRMSGLSDKPPVFSPMTASPDVTSWIKEATLRVENAMTDAVNASQRAKNAERIAAEKVAADAKAAEEQARLLSEAFAKVAAASRTVRVRSEMSRSGFNTEQIDRAVNKGGSVNCWGTNVPLRYSIPSDLKGVLAVGIGKWHAVALKIDGTIVIWNSLEKPSLVSPEVTGVTAIACGSTHTALLKGNGKVTVLGADAVQSYVPRGLSDVVAIAAGENHTLALRKDGIVVSWGEGSPNATKGLNDVPEDLACVVAIAAGGDTSIALKADGTLRAWGGNSDGQRDVPNGLRGIVAVSMGKTHAIALKSDGSVVAWGGNLYNQCNAPDGLTGIIAVSAGWMNTMALKKDGTVVVWGGWAYGEAPKDLVGVVAITAGETMAAAVCIQQ